MDMSPASLFASLIVGSVGFVLFSYGKKAKRPPHLVCGVALFATTYLAPSPLAAYGISAALCAALWVVVKQLDY